MCDTALIEWQEGFREFGYDDANDHPLSKGYTIDGNATVGFGFNISPGGGGISETEARLILNYRLGKMNSRLTGMYPWYAGLDPVRKQAIQSAVYNMGLPKFSQFKLAIRALHDRNHAEAAFQFRDSIWYRNPMTHNRASEIAMMIETGQYPQGFKPQGAKG